MTRTEAIGLLSGLMFKGKLKEAIDMAIKALSQEPKTQMVDKSNFDIEQYRMDLQGAYDCGFEAGKKVEQEPCTDAVSREAVDKYIARLLSGYLYDGERERLEIFSAYLWELPSVNPQPCDDAISRGAVKEMICAEFVDTQDGMSEWRNAVNDVVENLLHKAEQLPSVTQKSGKWINDKNDIPICSQCGYIPQYDRAIDDYEYSNYCPNCGARMDEPQESEVDYG